MTTPSEIGEAFSKHAKHDQLTHGNRDGGSVSAGTVSKFLNGRFKRSEVGRSKIRGHANKSVGFTVKQAGASAVKVEYNIGRYRQGWSEDMSAKLEGMAKALNEGGYDAEVVNLPNGNPSHISARKPQRNEGPPKERSYKMVDGVKVYPRTTRTRRHGQTKGPLDRDKNDEDRDRLRRNVGVKKHTPGGVQHDQNLHGSWSDGATEGTGTGGGGGTLQQQPPQGQPQAPQDGQVPAPQSEQGPPTQPPQSSRPGGRAARPTSLDQLTGQSEVRERLQIMVDAARNTGQRLDHVLFTGPPGLGKTTMARVLAAEMGGELKLTSGQNLRSQGDLTDLLMGLEDGDVVFIDEIHAIPKAVDEMLFSVLEDGRMNVDIPGVGKNIRVKTPDVTFIGATTNPEGMPRPMRDRFGSIQQLDYYQPEELSTLVQATAQRKGIDISPEIASELATRGRGTPRMANRNLRVYQKYLDSGRGTPGLESAVKALDIEGIDRGGFHNDDIKVMRAIRQYGTAGVSTIAGTVGIERSVVEQAVEPYLLRQGFIRRGSGGRSLTDAGKAYMDQWHPEDADEATAAVAKRSAAASDPSVFSAPVSIAKSDDRKHMVFGWANVAFEDGGQVVDHQGHMIDIDDLEDAAYGFNVKYRKSGDMHGGDGFGELVESLVVTEDKIAKGGFPQDMLGKWWIGFKVPEEDWGRVETGERSMFSIQGKARLEAV